MPVRGPQKEVTGKIGVSNTGQPTFSSRTSQASEVQPTVSAAAVREKNRASSGIFGGGAFDDAGKDRTIGRREKAEVTGKIGGPVDSTTATPARTQTVKGRNASSVNPFTGQPNDVPTSLASRADTSTGQQQRQGQQVQQAPRAQNAKGRNASSINPITGEPYAHASQPSTPAQPPAQQQQAQAPAPYTIAEEQQQAPAPPQQQQQSAGAGQEMSAEEKQEFMYEAAADMSVLVKDVPTQEEREALLNEQCDKLEAVLRSWTNPQLSPEEINQRVDWAWSTAVAMNEGGQ